MNTSDDDALLPDDPLRDAIRGMPLPDTPPTLAQQARRHVRRRRWQRRAVFTTASAAVLLVALAAWQYWSDIPPAERSLTPGGTPISQQELLRLDGDTLEALLAPPPVYSLAVLDRRLNAALDVLNLEEEKP